MKPVPGVTRYKARPERLRTASSDSGCDVLCDSLDIHDTPRHTTIKYCESRLQEIIKINLKQAQQQSEDYKTSLKSELIFHRIRSGLEPVARHRDLFNISYLIIPD